MKRVLWVTLGWCMLMGMGRLFASDVALEMDEPVIPETVKAPEPLARANQDGPILFDKPAALGLSKAFMENIVGREFDRAFGLIAPYSLATPDRIKELEGEIVRRLDRIEPGFGKPLGYRLVKEHALTDVMVKFTFLETFQRDALRWDLLFYRTPRSWIVSSVAFDLNTGDLFE